MDEIEKKPTIEELEALLNSGAEVPFEILPSGEIRARPTVADLPREILLRIPSQIEIAAALHSVPSGPHRETIGRMATALDCLRDGGWEFVEKAPKIERLTDLRKLAEAAIPARRRTYGAFRAAANPEAILALLAERDALAEDIRLAAGELMVDMADAPPGSLVARLLVANRLMHRERDALAAEVERLKERCGGCHICRITES